MRERRLTDNVRQPHDACERSRVRSATLDTTGTDVLA